MNPFSIIKRFIIRKVTERALEATFGDKLNKLNGGKMKGWRTLLINGGLAAAAAFLTFISGVDLASYGITGTVATIALAVVNFLLRFITTTPVGASE